MNLLNGILAFGAFAFTVPLVIHLLFRSRYTTLDWGAMYLLESVIRVNRRRMQLTQILLLLLRCLIPILLAFCLARPVWQDLTAFTGDAPRTLVIAIDDSRSLSVMPSGGEPLIETAKKQVSDVLKTLTRRDEVMIVRGSRLGAVVPKMGVSQALTKIRKLDAVSGPVSATALLEAAIEASREGTHPRRQILLVSDFQDNTFQSGDLEELRAITDTERASPDTTNLVVDVLSVQPAWDEISNVSVDEVSLNSPVLVKSREGIFSAAIRNGSDKPSSDLRLVWSVDGKPLDPRVITVPAKSTRANRLSHAFERDGMHEVSVSIGRSDDLSSDNQRSIAVEVMPQVDVLLVDGSPSRTPLQGQADFLAIALSPFAFGGDDRPDPVRVEVASQRRLADAIEKTNPSVIMMAGVGRLVDESQKAVASWVNRGGALVVFDGPAVSELLYNEPWKTDDQPPSSWSFPARVGSIIGDAASSDSSPSDTFTIDTPAIEYLPWRVLSPNDQNPFEDVLLRAFRQLEQPDDAEAAITLLKTTDGDPLCLQATAGKGTVIQFAISASPEWSNLPLRPVFLPMIQQMVLELAGKRNDATIPVGIPIVIGRSDWLVKNGSADADSRLRTTFSLRTPSGEKELPPPPVGEPIRITSTYQPGIYEVRRRISDPAGNQIDQVSTEIRIAEVDASESLMQGVTEDALITFTEAINANVFTEASELRSADRLRSFGYELWRPLLVLVLIALVLELWLQQNLVSRRATTGQSSVGASS